MPVVKVALRFREERSSTRNWSCGPCGDTEQAPLSFNSSACATGLKSLTLPVWAQLPEISILARVRPHLFHAFLHKECQRRGDLNLIIRVSAHDGLFSTTSIQKISPHFGTCHVKHLTVLVDQQTGTMDHWLMRSSSLARMRVYRAICFRRLCNLRLNKVLWKSIGRATDNWTPCMCARMHMRRKKRSEDSHV